MSDPTIICPNCATRIPLTEALSDQIKEELSTEFKQKQRQEIEQLEKQRKQLQAQAAELKQSRQKITEEVEKKLSQAKQELWNKAQAQAREQQAKTLQELQAELKRKAAALEESEKNELELRRKSRELEEREKKLELEMARRIDEERKKIVEQTKQSEEEQYNLKLREKDQQMEILKKTITDLKRQAEQGSMQIQGEAQEDSLKETLQNAFVADQITDVPAGVRGADLIQVVNGALGSRTGTIIWESKNTKVFSETWIPKLKSDQGKVKADIAILVSQAMPEDIKSFGLKNGVWVVSYQYVVPLAHALRMHVAELHKLKQSLVGQDDKMNQLYGYLTGSQFRNRVENIVMAFVSMKQDLETEKRSLQRIWSKREKEIERVIMSTSSLYGDLQGIIGGSLPAIQQLELADGLEKPEELPAESEQSLFEEAI